MADSKPSDDLLTVDEVANELKVNPQTVRNWIDRGQLPALRAGRRVRIQRSMLEQFVGMQAGPGAGRRASEQATLPAPPPDPALDREAVAAALDQIAAGFTNLAAALRADEAITGASKNASHRPRKTVRR
jgi:excisionase family DNA binding protein